MVIVSGCWCICILVVGVIGVSFDVGVSFMLVGCFG